MLLSVYKLKFDFRIRKMNILGDGISLGIKIGVFSQID